MTLTQITLPEAEALQAIRAGYVSVDAAGDWMMPRRVTAHAVALVRDRGFLVVPDAGPVQLTPAGAEAASPSLRRIVPGYTPALVEDEV